MTRYQSISLILALCSIAPLVDAASFDCKVAIGMVENLVCRDAELSKLDDELAVVYQEAMRTTKDRKALREQQRAWLREIRDRTPNLRSRYRERIEQLSSVTPLVSPPSGTFGCAVGSSVDNVQEYESKSLAFRFQNGSLVELNWDATWVPKSPDLRPGFHYRSNYSLSKMRQRTVPGYVILEREPIPGLREDLQKFCGIALSVHGETLYAYTIGCEGSPDTSHFDYTFNKNGSVCRPADAKR